MRAILIDKRKSIVEIESMSRIHRADNIGMHTVVKVAQRTYRKCPICKKIKRLHAVSKTDCFCSICIKKFDLQPYHPILEKEISAPPKEWKGRKRTSHNI
jgi:hypothetical protein